MHKSKTYLVVQVKYLKSRLGLWPNSAKIVLATFCKIKIARSSWLLMFWFSPYLLLKFFKCSCRQKLGNENLFGWLVLHRLD